MRRIFVSLMLLLLFGSPSIYAQGTTATLSGAVVDEKGAVLPDASVTVLNDSTGLQREATSSSEGYFTVSLLPPGHYIVKVKRQGFTPAEIKDLVLQVGDQRSIRIPLNPAGPAESVNVVDETSPIQTSPAVSTLINRQFIENLPMNGRSFQSLIILTPGVVLTPTFFGQQGQFSVNGQRSNANYFTLDGVSANIQVSGSATLNQTAGGSIPGAAANGSTSSLVSVDALQEFRIQTSTYAPEYGRSPGAQVSLVSRAGTNDFHGSLYEYFRNDVLDAKDWFANRSGLRKPPLRQNNFGFVLGGPVLLPRFGEGGSQPWYNGHNRTFFFASYEGLRLVQPKTRLTEVPSLSERQRTRTTSPQLQPYLNAYPLPNGPNLANGFARLDASYSDPSSSNATSIRLDHIVGNKIALFGRYNYAPSDLQTRAIDNTTVNTITVQAFKTETATLGATMLFTPNLNNEFRANWSRNRASWISHLDDFGGAVPPPETAWFPTVVDPTLSLLVFNIGGNRSSFYVGKNVDNYLNQVNLVDNISYSTGSHQLKFGADYRLTLPVLGYRIYSQFVNFTSASNLANGTPNPSNPGFVETVDPAPLSFTNVSVYAQDNWKVNRRLILTYGLRWEVNPAPTGRHGKQLYAIQGLENLATATVAPGRLYETQYTNFAPRVGAAFTLFQRAGWETVVRGGFGIFYDMGNGTAGNAPSNFPYNRRRNFTAPLTYPLSAINVAPPVLSATFPMGAFGFRAFDPNLKLPRVYQWNLAFEQSLGAKQTLSATYLGAQGRRLLRADLIQATTLPALFGGNLTVTRNTARSDYHAMQLQFQRRFSRGLQALASYTWSHSIDNASSDSSNFVRSDRVDPQTDRADSDFDVRHNFSGAITYNLPTANFGTVAEAVLRDWSIDGIFVARSATPVTVTTGVANLFGVQPRPNVDPSIPLYLYDPTFPGGKRINNTIIPGRPAGCKGPFCPPTAGQQGSLSRNALRSFPAWQLDLTMRRQFNFNERFNLQFRVEMFNIFNHPNFGDPVRTLSSSLFGESDRMLANSLSSGGGAGFNPLYQIGGPRSIQMVLRLQF
ncbi:MAG: TonB-dependent receptor [Acidobacteriota bacterium]|nr:TonB-dependent receptor [Acidobacteriota bacterium]